MRTKDVLYLRGIAREVKKPFKDTVHRREDTMSEVVEALMRLYNKNPAIIARELVETQVARTRRSVL